MDHESGSVGIAAGSVEGLSLEPMRELMALLGDPQDAVRVIHVTGTNGKGTVVAAASALLAEMGLTVGSYTSPHERVLNERIARNGEPIDDASLAEALSGVAAVEPLLTRRPTWFEALTAAALRWFADAPVDVAVVEVGLLGRYDATNVVDAEVAVITSVGGDHTDFRAGWRRAVAEEKAGIIGPGSTVVVGPDDDEVAEVVAGEAPAETVRLGRDVEVLSDALAVGGHMVDLRGRFDTYDDVLVPLHGAHQVRNVAIAVAAVESLLGRALPVEAVRSAVAGLRVPGRTEVVAHGPLVVLDTAHNADALSATAETLEAEFSPLGSRIVVLGQLRGRDPAAAATAVARWRPDLVVCTTPDGERGLPAAELAVACERAGLATETVADPAAAVRRALAVAAEEDMVLVTGSGRLLAPARTALVA